MNKLLRSQLFYHLSTLCKSTKIIHSLPSKSIHHLNDQIIHRKQLWSRQNKDTIFQRIKYGFNAKEYQFSQKYRQKPKMSIQSFLNSHSIQYKTTTNSYQIKYCPFCVKPHNNDPTNLHTLNINKEFGYHHCFRCGTSGSLLKYKEKVLGLDEDQCLDISNQNGGNFIKANENKQKLSQAQYFYYKTNIGLPEFSDVVQYINSRGITMQTLLKYNIGAGIQEFVDPEGQKHQVKCIYFPFYRVISEKEQKKMMNDQFKKDTTKQNLASCNGWSQIVKAKVRGSGKDNKRYMRQFPNGQRGYFGLNIVKDTDKTIVITQGEFDAMAVFQQTSIPTLSLPQGANNLPQQLIPYLSKFQKIILWMDNDQAGKINTPKIAQKIGLKRTYIVKHDFKQLKDANDILLAHPQKMIEMLQSARTIPDGNLITFKMMRSVIQNRIKRTEENHGAKLSWLPFFNKSVKGIRMGELSIISGPTGSGKTTFLSQLTLDLCKKDISVLWGSFQIRNEILMTSMMYQFSQIQIDKHMEKYQYFADQFSQLPLHFMNFYGSQDIQKVLSTIIFSIQKHNINVVVIDTLQFLLSDQESGFKKFDLQDSFMGKLRQISITYNVHIAIVIHPRKVQENQDLGLHSIYGTSKSTQQADNVWIIQNRPGFKLFEIKKNRYDGQLGRIPIGFDKKAKVFFQLKKGEFESVLHKQKSMPEIATARKEQKQTNQQYKSMTQQEIFLFEQEIEDSKLTRKRA